MYEIFTSGRFEVEPGNEDAFIAAWSEFAVWVSQQAGAQTLRLFRDVRNPGRFVSFGQWDAAEAVRAWKSSTSSRSGSAASSGDGVRADGVRGTREGHGRDGRGDVPARGARADSRSS